MENKTVIVTGASRGVGAATARHAAHLGARLVINARTESALDVVAGNIREAGGEVEVVPGDLQDDAVCRRIVDSAASRFGRIDALVNNAGVLEPLARTDDVDVSAWVEHFRINVIAPMFLTSLALPGLREQSGRVVNVSSGAAVKSVPGWGAYCMGKAALNMGTRVAADEHSGVVFVAVRPGMIDTDMQGQVRDRGRGVMDDEDHERFVRARESGELASADTVGRALAVIALFADPAWSGEFVEITEDRVADLVASKTGGR